MLRGPLEYVMRGVSVQEPGLELQKHPVCVCIQPVLVWAQALCQEWLLLAGAMAGGYLRPVWDVRMLLAGASMWAVLLKSRTALHVCLYSGSVARIIPPPGKTPANPHGAHLCAERVASPVRDPASHPPAPLKTSRGGCIAECCSFPDVLGRLVVTTP